MNQLQGGHAAMRTPQPAARERVRIVPGWAGASTSSRRFLRALWWGQGISKEALQAMLGFGFEDMHLNRIEAETVASNTESVRLLERSGFYLDGIRREFTLEEDGAYHGGAIHSLLRREYFPEDVPE
jgi:RimJ/RimL family protein N-acetyltransferase